jgi:hypothetical protein
MAIWLDYSQLRKVKLPEKRRLALSGAQYSGGSTKVPGLDAQQALCNLNGEDLYRGHGIVFQVYGQQASGGNNER